MSLWQLALRSLRYHRRANLAIALGVAAATAVLTGALIVGDSMRGSLRHLTLERLGRIDSIITSDAGFFREALADELASRDEFREWFQQAETAIYFPSSSADLPASGNAGESVRGIAEVNVMGIHEGFWRLGEPWLANVRSPGAREVVINQVLANDLGITDQEVSSGQARITLGIPKPRRLPSDSALGNKDDLVERLVDLKVIEIVPARSLGRFGLYPTQIPPRNAWVAIGELQSALRESLLKYKEDPRQANMILVATGQTEAVSSDGSKALSRTLTPSLNDLGLSLRRVSQTFSGEVIYDYYSLSSDRLVISDQIANSVRRAFPGAGEVLVYLANDISRADRDGKGIPFSIVAAIDPGTTFQLPSIDGGTIPPMGEYEIAVTQWTAADQGLKVGDEARVAWFEPETTHGDETEQSRLFNVSAIVALTEPSRPFRGARRGRLTPAEFEQRPTTANDPDLTPLVPGLTDAESIERWDLPFATADRIRPQDDEYWDYYRTTPKAYVSLETGRRLWGSRFGETTSFRIAPGELTEAEITSRLINAFRDDGHLAGLQVVAIKREGLAASSGSTPFDALFLGLSMFVIAAALVLVSLLFRLGLQKRSDEMGVMMACGFRQSQIGRVWLLEMLGVCLAGAASGVALGVGYAALMLWGLATWWVGAITVPFLQLFINWWTLPAVLLGGVVVCVMTICFSVRAARKRPVRALLNNDLESPGRPAGWLGRLSMALAGVCLLASIGLAALATRLGGEAQAGAFMGAGFLVLAAALFFIWRFLQRRGRATGAPSLSLAGLATTGAARNPLRSTLAIGLIAVASFLVLAISAFRLAPTREGTAGFDFVATTSQPVFADLDTAAGQQEVLRGEQQTLDPSSRVLSFRYKAGQDASCNNLYQSTQPQVLGVTPATIAYFDRPDSEQFAFTMTPGENPWRLLDGPVEEGVIPVIIDKNTAWYSLKVYTPGTRFTIKYDSGESVTFRLVGLLSNTVLQGRLLVSEANFSRVFPDLSGYRFFLLRLAAGERSRESEAGRLASALSDAGFDARRADDLLAGYLAVQNTYLSTFQSLGLLGLLLGTLGLAAVQLRTILERQRELGLLRAIGFTHRQLARMIVIENVWLLLIGLATGVGAALVTTLPHWFYGAASAPWLALAGMFAFIAAAGLLTSLLAARGIFRAPLLASLREG